MQNMGAGIVKSIAWIALALSAVLQPSEAQTTPVPSVGGKNFAAAPSALHTPNDPGASPVLPTIVLGSQTKRISIDTSSAYWVDGTGSATIMDAVALQSNPGAFQPRLEAQRHDLHGKALWLRFTATITDPQSHWFLELPLATMDDVTLYWQDDKRQWVHEQAGDIVPRSQWPVADRLPMFQLIQQRSVPSVYYLRVAHARVPFSAPLHIYRSTALVAQRELDHFFLGAYFGLIVLVALVCLALARAMRDGSFLQYVVYVVTIGIAQASFTGIAGQYLWPQATTWADLSSFFFTSLAAAAGLWFVRYVVKPRQYSAALDTTALILIALQIAVTCIDLVHPTLLGFRINTAIMMGSVLAVYAVIGYAWKNQDKTVRWLALSFLPVVLGVVPALLRNAGVINTSFWTQYGSLLGSAVEMPLLLYCLVLRSAVRSEGRARAAGLPTKDPLTGLANMRELLRQIHGTMTRATRNRQQYSLVLVELTNYAWFVKEHGREMGDRALVLLGTRLQLIARDIDTAGRIDDNHFVLLIEGPCKPAHVVKIAAQITATARRPSDLLPVGASIKLRVSCALMPDPLALALGDDANAQLGWLLSESDGREVDPRKLVRTLNF